MVKFEKTENFENFLSKLRSGGSKSPQKILKKEYFFTFEFFTTFEEQDNLTKKHVFSNLKRIKMVYKLSELCEFMIFRNLNDRLYCQIFG
jgi:hypothetical protein